MPPLPLIPNLPAGQPDINWGAMNPSDYGAPRTGSGIDPYTAVDEARRRAQMESDREYKLRVQQAKRQREEMAIRKGEAEASRWYNRQMVQIARDRLGEERRQFDLQHHLNTQQFQDQSLQGWTQQAVSLARQPKDWVSYKRMTSGVANNLGSIPGLSWASGGQVGNQTFAGNPETNSLANVHGTMGIGSGGGGAVPAGSNWALQAAQQGDTIANGPLSLNNQEQQVYQTADDFARNPQGAAAGWYESLDPLTRDLIQGAAESQGHDWGTVLSRWKRSRFGGGSSLAA